MSFGQNRFSMTLLNVLSCSSYSEALLGILCRGEKTSRVNVSLQQSIEGEKNTQVGSVLVLLRFADLSALLAPKNVNSCDTTELYFIERCEV